MAVPKKKHTPARGGKRRGGHKKTAIPQLIKCSNCKKLKERHIACPHCGQYK